MGRIETYTLALGPGITLAAASALYGKSFWNWGLLVGLAITGGGVLFLIAQWIGRKLRGPTPHHEWGGRPQIFGDINSNSGNNSGHIGSIHNHHHGKQPFTLTSDRISDVVAKCPRGVPVEVRAVGPQGSSMMQEQIVAALRAAGHSVSSSKVGSRSPMPELPLIVRLEAGKTVILITPSI